MSVLPVQFEEKAITYLLAYDPCTIKGWWKLAWPFFKPDGTGLNWDNSSSVSAFEYFNHWNKHRISDYRYIPFLLIPCHQRMHQWLEGAFHFCSTLWWRFKIKIKILHKFHLYLCDPGTKWSPPVSGVWSSRAMCICNMHKKDMQAGGKTTYS